MNALGVTKIRIGLKSVPKVKITPKKNDIIIDGVTCQETSNHFSEKTNSLMD
jgi:hypothetical protein